MLARHAQDIGYDFVIVLTPFVAARDDDAIYAYYEYICERVDIGIILFNVPPTLHPVSADLAKRLAALPNICAYKQADPSPAATHSIIRAVGDKLVISVADEAPWLTLGAYFQNIEETRAQLQEKPASGRGLELLDALSEHGQDLLARYPAIQGA